MNIQLNERQIEILSLVAEGKTNQQIAETLHLTENTIKWYLQQVYQELGVKNRVTAVRQARQLGILADPAIEENIQHNLPTVTTPFFGREQRISELKKLLLQPHPRLISICGLGGTGKTRLALETARQVTNQFEEGVFFIPVETVKNNDSFWEQCLKYLQVPRMSNTSKRQLVREYLENKHALLIFDNTEYLPLFQTEISWLLNHTKKLQVISTSRVRLNLQAEQFYPLDGLSYADGNRSPAYGLFAHVARRHRPGFKPNSSEQADMLTFCRLVEGLPLAIELAASWMDVLSPGQIINQLQKNLSKIEHDASDRPVRQRSLHAVIDYSWQFLSQEEQETLIRLSPLRGSFSAQAAMDISGCSPAVLKKLIHGSLIQNASEGRLKTHRLIHQFSQEQASQLSINLDHLYDEHMGYYLTWLAEKGREIRKTMNALPVQQIQQEWHQVEAAWWRGVKQKRCDLLENCIDIVMYFEAKGTWGEGMSFFNQTQTALGNSCLQLQARLDEGKSIFALRMFDMTTAKKLANSALHVLDDMTTEREGTGDYARMTLTTITFYRNGYKSYLEYANILSEVTGNYLATFNEFSIPMLKGMYKSARHKYEESVQCFAEIIATSHPNAYHLPSIRNMLAISYIGLNNFTAAKELYEETLAQGLKIYNYKAYLNAMYGLDRLEDRNRPLQERIEHLLTLDTSMIGEQTIGRIAINLGATYIIMGFYDQGREMLKIALELLWRKTNTSEFLDYSKIVSKLLIFELAHRRKTAKFIDRAKLL